MIDEFERIARAAWERSKTPLDRMYDHWMGEGAWEDGPQASTYRIFGSESDKPFSCHLCGATDRWVVEGDEVRRIARVFVCEHEPVHIGIGAIRQISTVSATRVALVEETYRFSD